MRRGHDQDPRKVLGYAAAYEQEAGVGAVAQSELRHKLDRSIVDGHNRMPPRLSEDAAALESLREAIEEELW